MNRIAIAAFILLLAVPSAEALLPPAPAPNPAEQAAAAEKTKEAAAKDVALLEVAMNRAVANFRKNRGLAPDRPAASVKAAGGQEKQK